MYYPAMFFLKKKKRVQCYVVNTIIKDIRTMDQKIVLSYEKPYKSGNHTNNICFICESLTLIIYLYLRRHP